ncbi:MULTISPECIES: hypothetical protein [Prevotellaceae]|uniref:hypothetical protein n=1 Tax=Prevotellaceae TaxID=171552 RepID=UPI00056926AC|nr:hypothetical protein [Prevotella phocaeensis]
MKKTSRRAYVKPATKVYALAVEDAMLAGSPAVQPGGGGGGDISIVPLPEDDDDNDLSGAKRSTLWDGEE